jgi:hypothetical protein
LAMLPGPLGQYLRTRVAPTGSPRKQYASLPSSYRSSVLRTGGAAALAGWSFLPRTPYTATDAASSRVLDLGQLRRHADEPAPMFLKTDMSFRAGPLTYLALSGGGADGAYGAGVLNGWTAAGTRPAFLSGFRCEHGGSDCAICISRPCLRRDIAGSIHQWHR